MKPRENRVASEFIPAGRLKRRGLARGPRNGQFIDFLGIAQAEGEEELDRLRGRLPVIPRRSLPQREHFARVARLSSSTT
jgi:hypothetical protein